MSDKLTKLEKLINPEVMADMIEAVVESRIAISPYAKVDKTLQGEEGDTITIPRYGYIGDAVTVGEGEEIPISELTTSSVKYTIKKSAKGVAITDEAALAAHGDPIGEINRQLGVSITQKMDNDLLDELYTAKRIFESARIIDYDGVVDTVDLFKEETDGETEKVMFIHPTQKTQLRHDPNFLSADKYDGKVMVTGEFGKIAGVRLVSSRKVKHQDGFFYNPIIQLAQENEETKEKTAAVTVFIKRDTNVEKDRKSRTRTTEITADKMYVTALTDETKVVIGKFVCGDTKLLVSPNPVSVAVAGEQILTIETDATDFTITSDKTSIATVDKTSKKITGVKAGTCNVTITAQATDKRLATVVIPVTVTAGA